jgi:hypothetical protein
MTVQNIDDARARMRALRSEIVAAMLALQRAGYRFVVTADRVVTQPPEGRASSIAAFEARAGALPLMVRAFYEVIGGVDFRGTHDSWPHTGSVELAPEPCWETDPLVVVPFEVAIEDPPVEQWLPSDGPLVLRVVPDSLAKAGYSAGTGYGVVCGAVASDPELLDAPEHETFGGHLQRALAWGGLPGFARIPDRPEAFLSALMRRTLD